MVVKSAKAIRELKKTMKKVALKDRSEVMEALEKTAKTQEAEAPVLAERRPGMVIDGNKVPFSYQWYCDNFPIVTFTPEETVPLTENGVKVQAYSGVEMHVPSPFKANYDRHRALLRKGQSLPQGEGYENTINLGAGPLEAEITVRSES